MPEKVTQEKLDDALFNATGTGNLDLIKQCVKAGGNPAKQFNGRHNCLRLAIQRAYFHIVRYFVEEKGMSLADDPKVFHYAALGNIKHPTMLAYLQEKGGDVNSFDEKLGTPLTLGMFKSDGPVDEQFVRWIIKNGGDVTHHATTGEQSSALHKAAEVGSIELIQLVLEKGGKVLLDKEDHKGATPLIIAAENGREDVVELFLAEEGVNPNQYVHYTPLFLAVQNGHYGVAKLLIDAGADVDIKDDTHGCAPLHLAASNSHLAIMKLLLEAGATADLPDKRGFTPLLMAATEDYFEAVRLLAKHGANVNFAGPGGMTCLHLIISRQQVHMSVLLLELGADPEQKDAEGTTPRAVAEEAEELKYMKNVIENYKVASDPSKVCNLCFILIDGKKRCSRCKKVYYCSAEHQKADWKQHKKICKPSN